MAIKRNQPCPCGSGKKYKKCCHKLKNSPSDSLTSIEHYMEAPRNAEDLASLKMAVALQPSAEKHLNLAIIQDKSGKPEEAISSLLAAVKLKPDFAPAYHLLGKIYQQKRSFEKAADFYTKALKITPDNLETLVNLGISYESLTRQEDALDCYNQALVIDQENVEVFLLVNFLIKWNSAHLKQIEKFEKIFASRKVPPEQQIRLAFALGKAFEELHDYEKAFYYFDKGNNLKRATLNYSKQWFADEAKNIKKHESFFISQRDKEGSEDKTPIFIIGMPRSGTTLVEQILDCHPAVYGAGEIQDVVDVIVKLSGKFDLTGIYNYIRNECRDGLVSFAAEYIDRLRKRSPFAKHIVNKTPQNFFLIGLLHLAFPKAKIIHCHRDPMDNCWSIFKHSFQGPHDYAYNLQELGEFYLIYKDLMEFWHRVFPNLIYDIKYEELIEHQELETRKLIQYCELPWDDRCLSFYNNKRSVRTASKAQVTKAIYKDSIKLWQNYEHHLKALVDVLHGQ